jgi:hypothetical protein
MEHNLRAPLLLRNASPYGSLIRRAVRLAWFFALIRPDKAISRFPDNNLSWFPDKNVFRNPDNAGFSGGNAVL